MRPPRGGPPEHVGDVLAEARARAGITEIPTRSSASEPPGAGEGPLNAEQEDVRDEVRPRPDLDGNKAPLECPDTGEVPAARPDAAPEASAPSASGSHQEEAGHAPGAEKAGAPPQPAAGVGHAPAAADFPTGEDQAGRIPAPSSPAPAHEAHACRFCQAPILWAQVLGEDRVTVKRHPDGKPRCIPVDFAPAVDGRVVLLDRKGAIVAYTLPAGDPGPAGARRRHLHRCPRRSRR